MSRDRGNLRLTAVVVMMLALAALVVGRLYQIQVVKSEGFRVRALDQQQSQVAEPALRGSILDRHGRDFAVTVESFSLTARPYVVEDPTGAARKLAPVLGLRESKLGRALRSGEKFVYLAHDIDPRKVGELQSLGLRIDEGTPSPFGLELKRKRFYPHDELAVHVVGYANVDDAGLEGIELQYDAELKGDPRIVREVLDAHGTVVRSDVIREPRKKPTDVVLTLDADLQYTVERELRRAVRETGAKAASAVMMDPRTGHVLAMANWPTLDANEFGKADLRERRNRAVTDMYEPGSTFKIVTMAGALSRGVVRSQERIFCENGRYKLGSRSIRDTGRHGYLTPTEILAKSSNIGMVKLVSRLDPEELWQTIDDFGFGSRTGIELPGESGGTVHPVRKWSGASQASLSFGHEINVTALQVASAFATIANHGVLLPPRVVRGFREHDGGFVAAPTPPARQVMQPAIAADLRRMLERVVAEGTSTRAAIPGYRVAGKSGTAQKIVNRAYSETEYVASFGGFAPASDPRIVALVVLDTPRGPRRQGGRVAAPAFRAIMEDALLQLRVPADREAPFRVRRTRQTRHSDVSADTVAADTGQVPDVRGMSLREASNVLARHGYRIQAEGAGVVMRQTPRAGARIGVDSVCQLHLEPRRDGSAG
jgi:cell division protein FtsI (penicillin-binding protein 3)